ncbi:MAG TPA: phosphatase PAP2 family protein, partial [Albitalea sp.]|nr:phosphatase PAP2 family protein [Albitalea sp.]
FPSGHAVNAFAAATYVHRRHGLRYAWPLYAAATYVGYTRVHANRHRWGDVIGSAAIAGAMTWWLVDPKKEPAVAVLPALDSHYIGVQISASW